jgi:hypothetical protein
MFHGSPLLMEALRASVGGHTTPMNRIPCISALASAVDDGFTRAACKKTDISRASRRTNVPKSSWIFPEHELGGSLQTFSAWPAYQSSGVAPSMGLPATSRQRVRHASGRNCMPARRGPRAALDYSWMVSRSIGGLTAWMVLRWRN